MNNIKLAQEKGKIRWKVLTGTGYDKRGEVKGEELRRRDTQISPRGGGAGMFKLNALKVIQRLGFSGKKDKITLSSDENETAKSASARNGGLW